MPELLRAVISSLRPPFLLLTPVCVGLGIAATAWSGHAIDLRQASVVLLGALAAHASVNLLNEWHDFRSGLDLRTQRTPFSGGSGALPANPAAAPAVLSAAVAMLALTLTAGLWLLAARGLALLPIGVLGVLLVLGYTPLATRHPIACLLAPGLGVGPLMVVGTQVALTGSVAATAVVASLVPMALGSGLLLLNQFPDMAADASVGRAHVVVRRGRAWSARLFYALLLLAHGALLLGVLSRVLPPGSVLGLAVAPLAWGVARDALRYADDLPRLLPALGRNVAVVLGMPVLMVVGAAIWP